jgi:hypothetical protein
MTEVYNLRIGDMVYNKLEGANIIGLVYKLTQRYVYYAVCARNRGDSEGNHYITKDHKVSKQKLYEAIRVNHVGISYASGVKRRRKIEVAV